MSAKDLKPQSMRTKEEQKRIARLGGKASGKARAEKKLMSQIYAEFLAKEHSIVIDERKKRMTGASLIAMVMKDVLLDGSSASVSLMREIREAIEGGKIKLTGPNGGPLEVANLTPEERAARIAELEKRRAD